MNKELKKIATLFGIAMMAGLLPLGIAKAETKNNERPNVEVKSSVCPEKTVVYEVQDDYVTYTVEFEPGFDNVPSMVKVCVSLTQKAISSLGTRSLQVRIEPKNGLLDLVWTFRDGQSVRLDRENSFKCVYFECGASAAKFCGLSNFNIYYY